MAKEKGIFKATGNVLVEIDPRYYRPAEVDTLVGDASKAERTLDGKQPLLGKTYAKKWLKLI